MHDEDMREYAKEPAPKRRRRIHIRLPRSYEMFRLAAAALVGAGAWGCVLGDIWLWRLLYG